MWRTLMITLGLVPLSLASSYAASFDGNWSVIQACDTTKEGVCLPQTTSGNIDGEVRRGWAERQAGRAAESTDRLANPCPATDAFEVRWSSRCRPQDPPQMGLAEDDEAIEAFPMDRADQSRRKPILPG